VEGNKEFVHYDNDYFEKIRKMPAAKVSNSFPSAEPYPAAVRQDPLAGKETGSSVRALLSARKTRRRRNSQISAREKPQAERSDRTPISSRGQLWGGKYRGFGSLAFLLLEVATRKEAKGSIAPMGHALSAPDSQRMCHARRSPAEQNIYTPSFKFKK